MFGVRYKPCVSSGSEFNLLYLPFAIDISGWPWELWETDIEVLPLIKSKSMVEASYQCCPYPPHCPPDPPHLPPLCKCSLTILHPPPPHCLLPLSLCVPSWAQCLIVFTYYFSLSGYHFIWNYVQWQVTAILLRSGLVRIEICYSLASWLLPCFVFVLYWMSLLPTHFPLLREYEEDSDYTKKYQEPYLSYLSQASTKSHGQLVQRGWEVLLDC